MPTFTAAHLGGWEHGEGNREGEGTTQSPKTTFFLFQQKPK